MAQESVTTGASRIFLEPQANGSESYLAAAIVKKHVPVIVTEKKDGAQFVLKEAIRSESESTAGKVASCVLFGCWTAAGFQIATVQLIDAKSQEVAWAYTVHKSSARAYRSTAEDVAKHLKEFLETHPR
jgi:hypothetical protein